MTKSVQLDLDQKTRHIHRSSQSNVGVGHVLMRYCLAATSISMR